MWFPASHKGSLLSLPVLSVRMKLLFAAAALLAVASCASVSLEDLEFHAWKLKFGETILLAALLTLLWFVCCQIQ